MTFELKQCPKCLKTQVKLVGFGMGKRICLKCEGKPSAALALEDH